MIDVKKFVVAFLILAAVASSLALASLGFSGSVLPQTASLDKSLVNVQVSNAFVAPKKETLALNGISGPGVTEDLSDPNNLTNQVADSVVNGIVAANPDGARNDGRLGSRRPPAGRA